MFSGLNLTITDVLEHEYKTGSLFFMLKKPAQWQIQPNTAISINGVSLPVRAVVNDQIVAEAVQHIIQKTSFGLVIPQKVTVEKALSPEEGISGHLIYGTPDGIGILENIENEESSKCYTFSYPEEYEQFIDEKISIAVDGISSDIIDVDDDQFTVRYPHFILDQTTMGAKKIGEYGNIECDRMIRYIDFLMEYKKNKYLLLFILFLYETKTEPC